MELSMAQPVKSTKKILSSLFAVVFLDLVGIGIVVPVLASLLLDPSHGLTAGFTDSERELLLGALTMVYPLMQFFAAPFLGALADRYGRRKLLIVSVGGTFVGYILFAIGVLTGQLWLLFVSRAIDGFTGGNISIAQAAIADVSTPETKQKNFGLIGMAFGVGFVVGPFLGGVLSDPSFVSWFSFDTPFWAASLFSIASILMIWKFLPETLRTPVIRPITWLTGVKNVIGAFKMKNLRVMFTVVLLHMLGFAFYMQFFQVVLLQRFGLGQSQIGFYYAYVGVWIALTQGIITRIVAKRFKPEQTLKISLLVIPLTFIIAISTNQVWVLYAITVPLMAIGQGLTMPSLSTIISNLAGKESQGEVMGIQQSVSSLGSVIPPLLAGAALTVSLNLPTIIGASLIVVGWFVFTFFFKPKAAEVFHEA
jgi:DHA1 family tetracycline resistance protein-like MFS transporter